MDFETTNSALLRFVEDFNKPDAMRSNIEGTVSYDDLLLYLTELEPVEEKNHLKLRPKFFSLPLLAQLRCLFKVVHQCSRISVSTLDKFISLLEDHSHENSWITHGILQLKRNRNKKFTFEHDSIAEDNFIDNYVFTKESESLKNELIGKLKTADTGRKTHLDNKLGPQKSMKEIEEEKFDLANTRTDVDDISKPGLVSDLWDKKVTVIDVDCDGDCIKEEFGMKMDEDKRCKDQRALTLIGREKSREENCIVITSESDDLSTEGHKKNKRPNNKALKRRLKYKNCTRDNINQEKSQAEEKSDVAGDTVKKQKMDNQSPGLSFDDNDNSVQMEIANVDKIVDQERSLHETEKLSELQFQLSSLKEKLSSDGRSETFAIQFWDTFTNLNHAQLSEACEFLMLSSLSEDTLLTLCDCLSSLNLSHQVETAFLNSTLSHKLSSLTDRPSQTMLNILYSVIQQKPRTTIEIISDCIEKARAGEPQCQVLLSLSKRNLPVDFIPFLIQQLSSKNIQVNSHLTSALQELLNRAADLDMDTLKMLLTSLSKSCEGLHTSVQFGKLLLTIITRFKRKITNEPMSVMTELVNGHKSSLKKSLLKKLDAE